MSDFFVGKIELRRGSAAVPFAGFKVELESFVEFLLFLDIVNFTVVRVDEIWIIMIDFHLFLL